MGGETLALSHAATSWRRTWQARLPPDYRRRTAVPVRFEEFDDEDSGAVRVIGYDRFGQRCYYHHAYTLHDLRTDDEDCFYEARTYAETLSAWRIGDGRWLTCTCAVGPAEACRAERRRYALAAAMPQ